MTGRTPFQETLLGDDAGSAMAWTLWRQGYERGVQAGHVTGYAEGVADMWGGTREVAHSTNGTWKLPTHAEAERARTGRKDEQDNRTGEQIVADAHASWGLTDRKDEAA